MKVIAMTRHEIARLVCKTLGLWFGIFTFLSILPTLSNMIDFRNVMGYLPGSWPDLWLILQAILPFLMLAFVSAALWMAPDWFARRMVAQDPTPVATIAISSPEILAIVFSACGVFIFADSLSNLTDWIEQARMVGTYADFFTSNRALWTFILKAAFGLWLIVGSRGIVGMIQRFRSWRTRPSAEEELRSDTEEWSKS